MREQELLEMQEMEGTGILRKAGDEGTRILGKGGDEGIEQELLERQEMRE